jgi:hypothetical protein
MAEAIPILGGIVLGVMLHECRGRVPGWIAATLITVLAASATIASGEFRASWGYLLVDASLVIGGAAFFLMAAHPVRARLRSRG